MPGSKPGERRGGRKAGTPNKARVNREEAAAEAERRATEGMSPDEIADLSPLAVMLLAMRTAVKDGKLSVAAAVAKEAAPYLHPKLSSETLKIQNDDSKRSVEDIERELAEIERCASLATPQGALAPPVQGRPEKLVH
jgi:hypothetical protein